MTEEMRKIIRKSEMPNEKFQKQRSGNYGRKMPNTEFEKLQEQIRTERKRRLAEKLQTLFPNGKK